MNGNSNGKHSLKRMELVFKDNSYVFTLNPHQYDLKIPNRVNLVYTKGGAFIDMFGEGIKELNISGITGFKGSTNDADHGYKQFLALKKLITDNMNNVADGKRVDEDDLVRFYNHTDGEAYMTVPIKMSIMRNVNEPLLFKYDLSFYVIQRVGDARANDEVQTLSNVNNRTDGKVLSSVVVESTRKTGNEVYDNLNNIKNNAVKLGAGIDKIIGTHTETILDRTLEKHNDFVMKGLGYTAKDLYNLKNRKTIYYDVDKNGNPKERYVC